MSDHDETTRRSFLKTASKAGLAVTAGPLALPRRVLGGAGYRAPSDTVNVAGIGVGGKGKVNLKKMQKGTNVVAMADVDHEYASEAFGRYPDATQYFDYRRMLDEHGDQLDGVVIATPDHTHARIAVDAMRRGLHVFLQKPLTWSVAEARTVGRVADETGVVTQMGNQGHSGNDARLVNEYIRSGVIGEVREVHVWTNRPIWPQGIDLPEAIQRIPETLEWDLFLGPAPQEPYHEAFHPFKWRGWVDYGTGALGDMGAHLLDHPWWALELDYPETVETRTTSFNDVSWPHAAVTHYDFPARSVEGMSEQPPVELTWYTGNLKPERPDELKADEKMGEWSGGALYIGKKGKLVHGMWGRDPKLLPKELAENTPTPKQQFERIERGTDGHEMNWVRAITGEADAAVSDFDYAVPLTEVMLLGMVSLRAGQQKIRYDPEAMQITNAPDANQYLRRQNPREAWALDIGLTAAESK
jgi:predicted dehydrogenase